MAKIIVILLYGYFSDFLKNIRPGDKDEKSK